MKNYDLVVGNVELNKVGKGIQLTVNGKEIRTFDIESEARFLEIETFLVEKVSFFKNGEVQIYDEIFYSIEDAMDIYFRGTNTAMSNCVYSYLRIVQMDLESEPNDLEMLDRRVECLESLKSFNGSDMRVYESLGDEIYSLESKRNKMECDDIRESISDMDDAGKKEVLQMELKNVQVLINHNEICFSFEGKGYTRRCKIKGMVASFKFKGMNFKIDFSNKGGNK